MTTTRCDVPDLPWSRLVRALLPGPGPDLWRRPDCVPVHSGKAGLNHVFSYLRASGALADKNAKILVPPWLGYWVYNAMRPHGFPVLHDDGEIKAAVAYHQYGFPQDMDEVKDACARKRVVLVEDCAHALGGTYKGRPLGTEGAAGVFSLSKFYPSLIGGAVRSADPALRAHVERLESEGSRLLALAAFAVKFALQRPALAGGPASVVRRLNEAAYAGYPRSRRLAWAGRLCALEGARDELEHRRRRYRLYRELLPGHEELQRLEPEATPYVVPLMHPRREALDRIASALRAMGLETGVYAFDANRNLFNARYVPCVWLPVHGGVSEELAERVASAVKREL